MAQLLGTGSTVVLRLRLMALPKLVPVIILVIMWSARLPLITLVLAPATLRELAAALKFSTLILPGLAAIPVVPPLIVMVDQLVIMMPSVLVVGLPKIPILFPVVSPLILVPAPVAGLVLVPVTKLAPALLITLPALPAVLVVVPLALFLLPALPVLGLPLNIPILSAILPFVMSVMALLVMVAAPVLVTK